MMLLGPVLLIIFILQEFYNVRCGVICEMKRNEFNRKIFHI